MRALSKTVPILASCILCACTSVGESSGIDSLTQNIGRYAPPPSGLHRPKIGIPPFSVRGGTVRNIGSEALGDYAADQLTTLVDRTGRFRVIERAQLDQVLREQSLDGVVAGDELATRGDVRGLEYLLLGKITGLSIVKSRVQSDKSIDTAWIPGVPDWARGTVGYADGGARIEVQCGVDLRLVDPRDGSVFLTEFTDFRRVDHAQAFGLQVLGARGGSEAEIEIVEDDHGRVLRLALDDVLRKMLPRLDRALLAAGGESAR